ncbi:RsmB/NOP family class I SAM-dependent RNA methyltransferase [Sphingomonas sp. CGMCC 1.13654]|uniref:RsmB/NOP family class I SAM-dependent RNA methyltransferase n=1 Tax=Sphingomonas chungangi TaxID=2683589 RepID=A0A838KZM0_9SPHN|nr:RsmB/NOP family class I SAM-dependent RNA methyltransferase [Sphingomonas chungangi]MBA2932521.1 RsmB/NOP family class I SAM-dependent RNA methyltransferase [Sphingomonas chungangi]MVW56144.1 SAM-dependent methyltransferase [Sphingomonas chungangi]
MRKPDRRPTGKVQAEPDPPGTPARRAALKLLDAVLRQGLPLEAALGAANGLPNPSDRGLARAIASEVLRRLPDLDALIDETTDRVLPDDAKARFALRIALVQALALGTPPHAAIATALPLVDGGPRRLVHGVFGTLMRSGATLPEPPHLLPDVAERWSAAWGEEAAEAARASFSDRPPLDLTLADPSATEEWAGKLGATSLMPGHLRLDNADVTGLPGFEEGAWWVQDLSASLPARLIGRGDGAALDLCAAPGGKTLQLAASGWRVTAVEMAAKRLGRLSENLARMNLSADLVEADVMQWQPQAPADAVLLDAPCSATGIFRRHPDVLHRVRPRAIAELAEVQAAMLARAGQWVKPGGVLVYAVCSLEPREGEGVASTFSAQGFAIDPVRPEELPTGLAPNDQGFLRIPPGSLAQVGGCDGFFIARWRRDS